MNAGMNTESGSRAQRRSAGQRWAGRATGRAIRRGIAIGALLAALILASCGSDSLATTQQAAGDAQQSTPQDIQAQQQELSENPDAVQVRVIIDSSKAASYNDKYPDTLGSFDVYILPDQSVLDALKATGADINLRGGTYVESIGGIAEKTCGPNSGWVYYVDGTFLTKTADAVKLQGNETVRWAYTIETGDTDEAAAADA